MSDRELRRRGKIENFHPMFQKGSIEIAESGQIISFQCKHVRSDVLRRILSQTKCFGNIDVCLTLSIPVTFTICDGSPSAFASRIDLDVSLPVKLDLVRPSEGYIHFFGRRNDGKYAGWINPRLDDADDSISLYFAFEAVVDPLLCQYLNDNSMRGRGFWLEKGIKVR